DRWRRPSPRCLQGRHRSATHRRDSPGPRWRRPGLPIGNFRPGEREISAWRTLCLTVHAPRNHGCAELLGHNSPAMTPLAGGLPWPDYAVLFAALAGLLLIGGAFTREQRDTSDFFLARRRIQWWAACLSFLATEISAVTIISVPATAYSENWEYGQ